MTAKIADRVKETSTTTGTGTLDLAGAVSGFQTFVAGIGTGNTCYYAIAHQTAAEWETGIGTVTDASPDTLSRTTILASSNSGSAVSLSSGTKDVFCTVPASQLRQLYPLTPPPVDTPTTATTLSGNGGSINNSTTTMLVADSSGFPATPFMCIVGTEQMKVTTVSGLTWTVTRGYNGSSAASHNDGVAVTLENWEWRNQGSATATATASSGIFLYAPKTAGTNIRARKRLIGSNTSIRAGFLPNLVATSTSGQSVGLFLRESGTGKVLIYRATTSITPRPQIQVTWGTAETTLTTNITGGPWDVMPVGVYFFRMEPTVTTMLFWFSVDGDNWIQVGSLTKTTAFTTGPDEWGFYADCESNTFDVGITLISWNES